MTNPPSTDAVSASIDSLATWIGAYREACANRDRWAEVADRAKQQITQQLDQHNAQVGTVNGRPAVRWTHVSTRRLDTKALREAQPDLVEQYTRETTSRRFTLVEQNNEAS